MAPERVFEFRCPVHGFIQMDEWERDIVAHAAMQRLRRIRQLAWTDYVYPGAMHTRFEHSLGVMHTATRLFDSIASNSKDVLSSELHYNADGLDRDRRLVRLAALTHDVGHGPFSHASEELCPRLPGGSGRYEHDRHYSAEIIRNVLRDVIENHRGNSNYGLKASEVAALVEGSSLAGKSAFWREIISGQMDADRMDYLLRDSLHAGVRYGTFDIERLIHTIRAVKMRNDEAPRLGVEEGGWHAAESLIIARYMMFNQVYAHRTRIAYDHHISQALAMLLPNGVYPAPDSPTALDAFLAWDDWRVLGMIARGEAGDHGQRLMTRNHYREVYHTPEVPDADDLERLDKVIGVVGLRLAYMYSPERHRYWYKLDSTVDIPVQSDNPGSPVRPLSAYSGVVRGMTPSRQVRVYVRPDDAMSVRKELEVPSCR